LADLADRFFFGGVVALPTSSVSVIIRPSPPAQVACQAVPGTRPMCAANTTLANPRAVS
jgi:hypothetical protein